MAAPPPSDPHRFGRVDDDGTVWLISAAGERIIGSWQAGDTEAAFAHFGRRFDDLSTEITLMEERLASGTGDARKIKANAAALAETLPTAPRARRRRRAGGPVGQRSREHAEATVAADRARRDEHRAAQTARKEALAAEAEELAANSTQWKAAGDRLRAILDEWKTITGLDRKTDDALWKRYSAARETFNRRRGSHFAELDRERAGARQAKERLCERAEELSDSTDWAATSAEFRNLLTEWKAAGPRGQGRRRRAVAPVQGRPGHLLHRPQRRDRGEGRRVAAPTPPPKRRCWPRRRRSTPANHDAARAALRSIADKWDAIGKVPRERSADLERRLRAVEKKVRDAGESDWADPRGAGPRRAVPRPAPSNSRSRRQKAAAAGRTKEAEEAKANAEQWRQWADAAADALTRRS